MAQAKWWTLTAVCIATFMLLLDVTIVNVALERIRADLGFSTTGLQWVVNAYAIACAGFLLLGGRAADLLGRKPMFMAGIAVFGLGSAVSAAPASAAALVNSTE